MDIEEAIEGHSIKDMSAKDRLAVNIVTNVGEIRTDQYRGMQVKVINQCSRVRLNYQGSLYFTSIAESFRNIKIHG